jgi:hypothetical protein
VSRIRSDSCGVWTMVSCIKSGLYDGVDCDELHKVWFMWWCRLWRVA